MAEKKEITSTQVVDPMAFAAKKLRVLNAKSGRKAQAAALRVARHADEAMKGMVK